MQRYRLGDRIRIDIPDETDPDFEFHAEHGIVINIAETGRGRVYKVGLEHVPITMEVTPREIRPPFQQNEEFTTDDSKFVRERQGFERS